MPRHLNRSDPVLAPRVPRWLLALGLLLGLPPGPALPAGNAAGSPSPIRARYELALVAGEARADARIIVEQADGALRELVLDDERLGAATGDGQLLTDGGRLRWRPPARGGTLRYRVLLNHPRAGRAGATYDAFVGGRFAIFRGEDAFPVIASRRARGSRLAGELRVGTPRGWSVVSPYRPDAAGRLPVVNPGGRLARPIGWVIAGDIGTRRDVIGGLEVTVSAPRGLRMERVGMLALLRWTLPELLPRLQPRAGGPAYVNIVSAAAPLWLGALSAPNSVFVHADRPLISENGTSTIVHEMVHVLLAGLRTPADQDWIDEGLAEYLALQALKDSGTVSPERYAATIADFRQWGAPVKSLRTRSATGPVTARAVAIFHDLDRELKAATGGRESLADVVGGLLAGNGTADLDRLRDEAARRAGRPLRALAAVPGFD
jgi:hypothetical protein